MSLMLEAQMVARLSTVVGLVYGDRRGWAKWRTGLVTGADRCSDTAP
jgi:hypothetical protein